MEYSFWPTKVNSKRVDLTAANRIQKNRNLSLQRHIATQAWTEEFWQSATWENFFCGERDEFLFQPDNLPNELDKIRRLLKLAKNLQPKVEIGKESEIEFLAINILLDAYNRSEIDKHLSNSSDYEDLSFPYAYATTTLRNLWNKKRRLYIVERIVHYASLGGKCNEIDESITILRELAKGQTHMNNYEIYALNNHFPTVYIPENEYIELQQIIEMLENFNNIGIEFHKRLRSKMNQENKNLDIKNSTKTWFDQDGGYIDLVCDTANSIEKEASLEKAMLSILKKNFMPKRTKKRNFLANIYSNLLKASNTPRLEQLSQRNFLNSPKIETALSSKPSDSEPELAQNIYLLEKKLTSTWEFSNSVHKKG